MQNEKRNALVLLNIGTFVMSVAGLFAKLISWPAVMIILARLMLTAPFLAAYLLLTQKRVRLPKTWRHAGILCGLGVLMAVHWSTYFGSVQYSTVAVGILSAFTAPIMMTFLEPLFDGKRICTRDIVIALFAFSGIVMMVDDFSFTSGTFVGVLLGMTSALLVSLRNIWSKCLVREYAAPTVLFWQMIFGGLFLSPLLLFIPIPTSVHDLQLLLLLAAITAFGHSTVLRSNACIGARATGVMMMVQPLYAILIAIPVLGEIPDLRVIIGGVIVLSAAVFETLRH